MGSVADTFNQLGGIFNVVWIIFANGGWAVLVLLIIYMLYRMYLDEIQEQYVDSFKYVFLSLRVPKENLASTIAVEQIFYQLHSLHTNFSFGETYMEGAVQLWYSFEIVSLGGKISFIIRTPVKMRHTVEAAVYAQYPDAEITEVNDYLENFSYEPRDSDLDMWGCEWKVTEPQWVPIRSYKEFEHPTAEVKVYDTLAPMFEALSRIEPHEFFGYQILAWPVSDEEWHDKAEAYAQELLGEEPKKSATWGNITREALTFYNPANLFRRQSEEEKDQEEKDDKGRFFYRPDVEKERINAVQHKAGKPGYRVKIRTIYLAPKDRFDKSKRAGVIGALRTLGSKQTNKIKPDLAHTWTKKDYLISPSLEKPYTDWVVRYRKRQLFKGYKKRSVIIGFWLTIMNTEELATLFHLPLSSSSTVPPVDRAESKKAQPPVNLPVGELETF